MFFERFLLHGLVSVLSLFKLSFVFSLRNDVCIEHRLLNDLFSARTRRELRTTLKVVQVFDVLLDEVLVELAAELSVQPLVLVLAFGLTWGRLHVKPLFLFHHKLAVLTFDFITSGDDVLCLCNFIFDLLELSVC